ncbi:MAG TPA: energy-coupling factor transporter ATPase [Oscillospiraceae bacterium]|nr:energy-coupling factor transporter ATPase [Oscillospiraceae bacterium]
MSYIKTEGLTYVYSKGTPFEKKAIDNINIEIEQGEFVGIIGHTGSGKSTFIQHLNGLLRPDAGKVYIDGKDIWADKSSLRAVRFKVGLVFQYPEYQLFEETVYKDIAFGPRNMELTEQEIDRRVHEAAQLVGLREEHLTRSPFELSGGQKRRAAIAGVIAMEPRVLILDEPTAGLDPKGRDKILRQLHSYHEKTGSTVLIVSHSMEDIAKHCKKVLVLNKAQVYCYEPTDQVFSRAKELTEMGLNVPQVTRLAEKLASRGVDLGDDIYTVERCKERLLMLLKGVGSNA